MSKARRIALAFVIVFSGTFASGCGKNGQPNLVSNVVVKTTTVDGDLYAEIQMLLQTGQAQLPSFDVPIINPNDPTRPYGRVAMKAALTGGSELDLSVNVSKVSNLPTSDGKLPNGASIPVGGLGDNPVYGVPVGGNDIRLYFAFAKSLALVGTAIPIKEFDQIANYVGGANLFIPFQFQQGIRGVAGVFTGTQPNQSGVAIFVDVGQALDGVINPQPSPTPGPTLSALSADQAAQSNGRPSSVFFFEDKPSSAKEARMRYELYKLNKRKTKLNLR